jgi:predicted O-methyltransferase YrrM
MQGGGGIMDQLDYVDKTFASMWENKHPSEGRIKLEGSPFDGKRNHTRSTMYTLVKILRPRHILEIGSMGYDCADIMAAAMNEHGIVGEIHSIDIRRGGYNGRYRKEPSSQRVTPLFWLPHHTGGDEWKKDAPIEHPEFKDMDNDEIFVQNIFDIGKVAPKGGYDLIFIDGDHSFQGAAFDFEYAKVFGHENTVVVMDDLCDDRHTEVRRFWDSLTEHKKLTFEKWNEANPELFIGMGLCTKSTS